ncbi:MAG TPA: MGMT family protein [Candidatus Paceibacterota bacterium]|jgi:methylated-DNA-protein-cysteine methyltransferase-like protein
MKTFSERVVEMALSIPKGRVTTYGHISRAAGGGTLGARSITSILSKAENDGVKNIPFHRIVYANGKIWVNAKCRKERLAVYKNEGIKIDKSDSIVNLQEVIFEFK